MFRRKKAKLSSAEEKLIKKLDQYDKETEIELLNKLGYKPPSYDERKILELESEINNLKQRQAFFYTIGTFIILVLIALLVS